MKSSGSNAGAVGIRNGKNFVQAYKAFYKESDTHYGEKDKADFNNGLFTNYMAKPDTSEGERSPGLVLRRKAEWVLFQTGWFNERGNVNAYCIQENSDSNSSSSESVNTNLTGSKKEKMEKMIARAIEIANDADGKAYTYSSGGKTPTKFDCSGLCYYLYKEYFNKTIPGWTGEYGNAGYVGNVGNVELQPGDILWRKGHVEMYIGNNKRVGAHDHYPSHSKDDITVEKGIGRFTKVYRFVK